MTNKAHRLADLFSRPGLDFLMGAHDALSARIAEEAGFAGLWVSGLGLSAANGLRDANELSWTQVLERVEMLADRVDIPGLVDLDTGYGDFNNVRLVMRRLARIGVGGGCIEDKLFPKTNSFVEGYQELADPAEFGGRLRAGKDVGGNDVYLVARCEAMVLGRSVAETVDRCGYYEQCGADAILVHSKSSSPDQILEFMAQWGARSRVAIVPTTYSRVPSQVFADAGVSIAIWANQSLRAAITGIEELCRSLYEQRCMVGLEDGIAGLRRVFDLTGNDELEAAKTVYDRYFPEARSSDGLVPS
jgi:phosphoenolpyruvate phosphomutase